MKERALGPSAGDVSDTTSRLVGGSGIVAGYVMLPESSWDGRIDTDSSGTGILAMYV